MASRSEPEKPVDVSPGLTWSELDLGSLISNIWRYRWLIIGVALSATLVTYVITCFMTKHYTAQVTMLPQQQKVSSGLLGQLAGFTGASIDGGSSYEELYDKIVKSDRILDLALDRKWEYSEAEEPVLLYEVLGMEYPGSDNTAKRDAEFFIKERLREEVLAFSRERLSGYMTLRVTMPKDPELAANIANFLASALDNYNREFQVSKATEQREFIDGRLQDVEIDLHMAEAAVVEFTQSNRAYQSSPTLKQRYDKLQREVSAQTSIWVELRRQLEMAKIDEHKELLSIFVLDDAYPPVRPSSPRKVLAAGLALFFGGAISLFFVLVREQLRSRKGQKLD